MVFATSTLSVDCEGSTINSKTKGVPVILQVVLAIEWLFAIFTLIGALINLWLRLVQSFMNDTGAYIVKPENEFNIQEFLVLLLIFTVIIVINFSLTILLGKGVIQGSISKCKIWVILSIFLVLASISIFMFSLQRMPDYLENVYYVVLSVIIGYKVFTILLIINFIRKLRNEMSDEVRLFPSTIL